MKLLSVMVARAVWLFDILDLNPKGKSIFPDLFDWLKDNYQFQKFPKSISDVDQRGGWVFSEGNFQIQEEIFIDVELSIYNDGLVANTRSSTKDAEAFLQNVLESACKEFSLIFDQSMIRRKLYLSEMNVKLDGSLSRINPALEELAAKISSAVGLKDGVGFQFGGLSFLVDALLLPLLQQYLAPFALERKVGAPFSENRFYSKAPLPTEKHLELLSDLEKMII